MKNFFLVFGILLPLSFYGQFRYKEIPASLSNIAVPNHSGNKPAPDKNDTSRATTRLSYTSVIGTTLYDLQTDGSMQQRIISSEDGKMAAVWQRSAVPNGYADVGTGYNFYNGTSWGPFPVANIDNFITHHPSIARWGEQGEIVVTKQVNGTIMLMKRTVAGTGTWTYMFLDTLSSPNCDWPAVMTSGPAHELIHILALTPPTENGGTPYLGLNGALLYWRSRDGGATWEKEAFQIPDLTAVEYYGFTPDSYAWSNPRGDTIAFVYGDNWSDEFIMYSTDAGDTWHKLQIADNPYKGQAPGSTVPSFYCSDGSNSIALDKFGIFHVTFGRMRASEDTSGRLWYPYTDGLIYWNSLMPELDLGAILDSLYANGNLVGWIDYTGGLLEEVPLYNAGLSSYGSISLDDERQIISIFFSGVVVENPWNGINYRHIKVISNCLANVYSENPVWPDNPVDLNSGIDDLYLEFMFPSAIKLQSIHNENYICEGTDVPGSHILDPSIPIHESNTSYYSVNLLEYFSYLLNWCPVGVTGKEEISFRVANSPNPANGFTTFDILLPNPAGVILEVYSAAGIKIFSKDLGIISKEEKIEFDTSQLPSGIYFYNARTTDGQIRSGKMIVI